MIFGHSQAEINVNFGKITLADSQGIERISLYPLQPSVDPGVFDWGFPSDCAQKSLFFNCSENCLPGWSIYK